MTTTVLADNFSNKIAKFTSKNINPGTKHQRKYLSPCIGGTTSEARSQAMAEFLPKFQDFILASGVTEEMQTFFGFQYRVTVDPCWNTSAADGVSVSWKYLGGKFVIWSNGQTQDGGFELHLYGELLSGQYCSGGIANPEEFGRKFALLTCEAKRIDRLPWPRKVPEQWSEIAQIVLTCVMCLSFVAAPNNDWEKNDYLAAFLGLTTCSVLSCGSKIKPKHSLVDENIEQKARIV